MKLKIETLLRYLFGVKCAVCGARLVASPIRYSGQLRCHACTALLHEVRQVNWYVLLVITGAVAALLGRLVGEWTALVLWILSFLILSAKFAKFEVIERPSASAIAERKAPE